MKTLSAFVFALLLPLALHAEEPRVTNPISYTWVISSCETWNCALMALVEADGNGNVIAVPSKCEKYPWLVLRRVEAGSVYIDPEEPFACELFDSLAQATARFDSLADGQFPGLLTSHGANMVVYMKADKRRATRH
ncbi:MAG TPA: hypothetical protein VGF48_11460 [Thermoanaerobaculia bacterium]|jgi:hypothetical protein